MIQELEEKLDYETIKVYGKAQYKKKKFIQFTIGAINGFILKKKINFRFYRGDIKHFGKAKWDRFRDLIILKPESHEKIRDHILRIYRRIVKETENSTSN